MVALVLQNFGTAESLQMRFAAKSALNGLASNLQTTHVSKLYTSTEY